MGTILFFEDDPVYEERTKSELKEKFGSSVTIKLSKQILSESQVDKTFIDRLYEDIKKEKSVELIVADINLYGIQSYRGLSAEVVSEIGRRLFIPVCIYARKIPQDIDRIKESVDATIKLESDPNDLPRMVKEIKTLYDGFVKIRKAYNRASEKLQTEPLPRILAVILKKPQYVDRFSLYSLGNQGFLKFVPIERRNVGKKLRKKTIPYILGNWLLLSIMKFPGILLNEIAAASYLNIDIKDFNKNNVRKLFRSALYKGPFADLEDYWWRYELDELLDKNKVNNGLELAKKKIRMRIKQCKCSVDPTLTAGYYCVITGRPVSIEKSTSEVSWIPKGADLARVSKPAYDKLKPWIGIF